MKNLLFCLLLFTTACNNAKNGTVKPAADAVVTPAPIAAVESMHPDNGTPYFSFTFRKNDSLLIDVTSDKPVFITDENEMTVMLDSSHHLLTTGDMLNVYIAGKTAKLYPVTDASHVKDAASMILSFAKPTPELPLFSPSEGSINIIAMDSASCTGSFEASRKESNGDRYVLKGIFQHAKLTY